MDGAGRGGTGWVGEECRLDGEGVVTREADNDCQAKTTNSL